jgi:hypothetical protein
MDEEDRKAAAVLREVENRIVWLSVFLVARGRFDGGTETAVKHADDALDAYQQRFSPIKP